MNTPYVNRRDYTISDDSMLQDSRTTQAQFVLDQTTFKTFDTDFKPPFETVWKTAIAAAETAPRDEQIMDVQTSLTQDVQTTLDSCANHFQTAKYYIQKAFPNQPAIWNEFGFDNYGDVRRAPDSMVTFMNVFSATANNANYKAPLIAAGYTQANIDGILTKRQSLIAAKTAQELGKNSRIKTTQNRISLMNNVWRIRTQIANAAKNIYADDYAKYKIYLLPASAEAHGIFSIEGTVTEKDSGKLLEHVQVSNGISSNDTETDSNGKYGFAKLASGSFDLTFSLPNYTTLKQTVKYKSGVLVVDVELEKA